MYMDPRTTSGKANSMTIPTRFIHCNSFETQICINSNAGIGTRLFITKVSRLFRVLRVSDRVVPALQEYTPRLVRHYTTLAGIFAGHVASGTPIDASGFFLDLFFDVISDLTFGESFNTLTTKQRSPIVAQFLKRQKAMGFMILNMPMLNLLRNLPIPRKKLKEWDAALEARKKVCAPI
jgi:hypothetical protein